MIDPTLYREVIQAAGSLTKLAAELDLSPQTVSNWRHRSFPADQCKRIEAITGISVQRLRPHDWRAYWPPVKVAA